MNTNFSLLKRIERDHFNKKLVTVNRFLLPFLVIIAYLFMALEAVTYFGFIGKYIIVDSRFFLILALISVAIYSHNKSKDKKFGNVFLKLNLTITPFLVFFYLVLQFLEVTHFRNYILSTYHIQPTNFLYIVFLNLSIIAIYHFLKSLLNFKEIGFLLFVIFFVIFACTFNGFVKTLDATIYSNLYIFTHLNMSHDDKMKERWGIYYTYIKFVEKNTPENSSILVPPQELPWYSTGNVNLDRYFLFPRELNNGTYEGTDDFKNFDYIMLVWGEWEGARKERYSWPKTIIVAEEVIYFNDPNNDIKRIKGNYVPEESIKNGVWGLIKIKK